MILPCFMKLHKFMYPVRPKKVSSGRSFSMSSKGSIDVRNVFKAHFYGPTASILSPNQQVYLR